MSANQTNRAGTIETIQPFRSSLIERYFEKIFVGLELLMDILVLISSFKLSYALLTTTSLQALFPAAIEFDQHDFLQFAFISSLIGLIVMERTGLYHYQPSMMNLIEIRKIFRSVVALFFAMILYSYYNAHDPLLPFIVLTAVSFTILLTTERMLLFKLRQSLHLKGINLRRVVIYGAGDTGRLLVQQIRHTPKVGYQIVAVFDNNDKMIESARSFFWSMPESRPNFYNLESQLIAAIENNKVDELIFSNPICESEYSKFDSLINICRKFGVTISFIPSIRGYSARNLYVNVVNGFPVITLGESRISGAEQISKRIFDFTLTLLITLLLLPLFLLISIIVKLTSPGPVFFNQSRVGKDGRLFTMLKFRTMYIDTPQYSKSPVSSEDPRITDFGRFLRRTSLDELPQLINVLRGEMSLVGPRPEMPFIVQNEYTDLHRERLKVLPGITGIWQISADRTKDIHDDITYDLFYIENRSFLLDIIILFRTLLFGLIAMRTF